MRTLTFDFFNIETVPSTYSWDLGSPLVEFFDTLTDSTKLTAKNEKGNTEYIGYAPFVSLSLSSTPGGSAKSSIAINRVADFGDYYNSSSNFTSNSTLSNVVFCHNYLMPGVYDIKLTKTEYSTIEIPDDSIYKCIGRHCQRWSWKSQTPIEPTAEELYSANYVPPTVITWAETNPSSKYEKRWMDRPEEVCAEDWFVSKTVYTQPEKQLPGISFSWRWYNVQCVSQDNPRNVPATWTETGFQHPKDLTWAGAASPCIELINFEVDWTWDNITCNLSANPAGLNLTWDNLAARSPYNKTWSQIRNEQCYEKLLALSASEQVVERKATLRVIEIPPTAYLDVIQPKDPAKRLSPLTVRLTPKFIKCGSFPIEKIVWDLGDGSPLLVQRRWAPSVESPFVFSDNFNLDWQDPRNYDIVYTYRKTPDSPFAFYPSLTAYSSSTGTSDCAAAVVGPLKLTQFDGQNLTIIQSELTDYGKIIMGKVDDNVALWKINK